MQKADLRGIDRSGENLSNHSFRLANLRGAILKDTVLHNTDFVSANLKGVNLSGADLYKSNLGSADLRNANLEHSSLIAATLVDTKTEKYYMERKKYIPRDLGLGANLSKSNLNYANLNGANLRYVNFEECSMVHANFNGADLRNANLKGAILDHANFVNADLTGANLATGFSTANFAGALVDALYRTRIPKSPTIKLNTKLRGAKLRGANLIGIDLAGVDLSDVDLRGANLRDAKMQRVNLTRANLTGAYLGNADLSGAILVDTILDGANLSNVVFNRVHVRNISYIGIYSEKVYLPFHLPLSIDVTQQHQELSLICDNAKFRLNDDFSIRHLSFTGKGEQIQMYYKRKPVRYTIGERIGDGGFGEVRKLEIETHEGVHLCAIKVPFPSKTGHVSLDELAVLERFPKALTCEGIIDIVADPDGRIIMPLANGTIIDYGTSTLQQAIDIVRIVGQQLLCLHRHEIRYYDIKPVNILYFCRKNGSIDITLADIGSIVPAHNKDGINYYWATFPPPGTSMDTIPENLPGIESYYTFLLIQLIYMLTGKGMAVFGFPIYNPSVKDQNVMPQYISDFHSNVVDFHKSASADASAGAGPSALALLDIIAAMGRRLEIITSEPEVFLDLGLPPLEKFLEILTNGAFKS